MLKTVSSITNAIGALNYKGTWNASTNSPALASGVGTKGDYYVVSVAGSTNLDGETLWGVGDWAVYNGAAWQKVEGGNTINATTVSASTSVTTPVIQATSSAGGTLKNNGGTAQLQWGSGGGSNLSLEVATNINPANAAVNISPTGTGTVTINPATASTMNNVAIGGTTPSTAVVTSINKMAITAPATSSTLAVADGKTFTVSRSLTLTGTDSTTMTFPTTSATIARTDAAQTFTGTQTFNTEIVADSGIKLAGTQPLTLGYDQGGGVVLKYNSDGNFLITPRSGYGSVFASGTVTMSGYGAGAATFSAAGVISSVSDETWKIKDGVPLNPDAMLQKLEPGYWFYNEEKAPIFGTDRQLGFYAQNVNEAIGVEAAPIPEEGKPWGYYDRSVLAITVMSLQKALATIENLNLRIEALEKK
jgi:hypothetical protein